MLLPAGTRLGVYDILGPLGAGGMGEVYKAHDARLERTVAVKILPPHVAADATLKQRFEREAKALRSVTRTSAPCSTSATATRTTATWTSW